MSQERLRVETMSDIYHVRLLTEDDISALYGLCLSNPRYYSYLKCKPDSETLKGELTALPPGKDVGGQILYRNL